MSSHEEEDVRPTLRGVSHAVSFWIALVAALVLIGLAPTTEARVVAAIYGAGLCLLFGGSATYHRWRWDPRWRPLLRRIDHAAIFVFIAASYTPVGVLALDGTTQVVVLLGVWIGALAGVIFSIVWIGAPRKLVAGTYLALGWAALAAMPQMIERLDALPLTLFAAGGVLYSIGAVVYARRRPDPWPTTFGFHEIFHAFTIVAAGAHYAATVGWVVPGAA